MRTSQADIVGGDGAERPQSSSKNDDGAERTQLSSSQRRPSRDCTGKALDIEKDVSPNVSSSASKWSAALRINGVFHALGMFKKSGVHHTPDTDTEHKAHLHRYAKHNHHKQLSKAHLRKGSQQWPDPRKYNPRSLCLFDLRHPFRRLVIAGRAL